MSLGPRVGCVILNWNGWQDTTACLDALRLTPYPNLFTVVVDNGSTDDSVLRIRAAHKDASLIETGKNLGFSGGNNVGIREALRQNCDYIWLLNNDTEASPEVLPEMVRTAESNPKVGAVGSVILYTDAKRNVNAWGGGRVNRWIGRCWHITVPPKDGRGLDFLTAASLLVRRKAFEQVGLMDDRFFLYWEDVELCFRLRRYGWKLAVATRGTVLHKVGASSSKNTRALERYYTNSGMRFLAEFSPVPPVSKMLFVSQRVLNRLVRARLDSAGDVLRGVRDYLLRNRSAELPLC